MTDTPIIIGIDVNSDKGLTRKHYFFKNSSHSQCVEIDNLRNLKSLTQSLSKVIFFSFPTKTYTSGFAGEDSYSVLAPEDRVLIRHLNRTLKDKVEYIKAFSHLSREESREKNEKGIKLDFNYLKNIGKIFKSSITKPNKQDYFYVVTKSLGINLIIKLSFAIHAINSGQLPLVRGVISTIWYQTQDIVFTVFGQTYMKFLGKMAGMFKVGRAQLGDFMFVYLQMSTLEVLNRTILGPLGENPLAYTWSGISLILVNNAQGLIAGGPVNPAINKIRKSGVISHKTMMHIYQLAGLTFHFGLFASFGYQTIYTLLTSGLFLCSWGSYIIFSVFFKDPIFKPAEKLESLEHFQNTATQYIPSAASYEIAKTK